ncbi:MAG: heat-inducible transcriptional repressor HrcA [Candidatus Acidiferrales bacterium]
MTAAPALQQKRHRQVLAEVVRAYIETGEPVSSRTIARMHAEALSSATMRNIMADLEEEGYLYQPHTSAGRVPTASAYRFYVEQIAAQATPRVEDRAWIRRELESATTPEGVMERASHVLAAVSRGLGIIVSPPLARTVVEHIRFLLLPDTRVLVVLVTGGGITRDKCIKPARAFLQPELDRIADYLNRHYPRHTLESICADLKAQLQLDRERYEKLASGALLLCDPKLLGEDAERVVYIGGAAQFAAAAAEFQDQQQLGELLTAIEERDRLVALLDGCIEAPEPVHVELGVEQMSNVGKHLAIVSAQYSRGEPARPGEPARLGEQGPLGILGPMRMHYERVITVVALMSQFFSEEMKGDNRS